MLVHESRSVGRLRNDPRGSDRRPGGIDRFGDDFVLFGSSSADEKATSEYRTISVWDDRDIMRFRLYKEGVGIGRDWLYITVRPDIASRTVNLQLSVWHIYVYVLV